MANFKNNPFGFRPVGTLTAATYTGATVSFPIIPSAGGVNPIFIGDLVCFDGSGGIRSFNTANDFAAATIPKAVGVFAGCQYSTNTNNDYPHISKSWPGAAAVGGANAIVGGLAEAMVICDPNVIYEIQCSSSVAANNYAGMSRAAVGTTGYLGLGLWNTGANGAVFSAGFYPDGTAVTQNPLTGDSQTQQSAIYLDIGGGGGGATGIGVVPGAGKLQVIIIGLSTMGQPNANTSVALSNNYASSSMYSVLGGQNIVTSNTFNIARVRLNYGLFTRGCVA